MPRIQFSDVTPPERRSIRDVPIPRGGKRKVPISIRPEPKVEPISNTTPILTENPSKISAKISEMTEKKPSNPYEYYYPQSEKIQNPNGKNLGKKKLFFGTAAIVLIVLFVVSMMTVFASATVSIVPKTQNLEVDTKINGTISKTDDVSVRYEVIKLSGSQTASVPATGEESAETKASGKIIVYNNFSTEPQRLIIRTRFETPEGLIYRIPESIIVPGKSIKNGVETPGSIEVTVFADEAGEKYNIKKTDFTIPGFKNDANRYKNFYARSETNMEGGFIGKRKVVAPADKTTALQNINTELVSKLQKDLESKVPEGLALLQNSIIFKSQELPAKDENSSVILGQEVTAYAIMLNKTDLANKIISEYMTGLPEWNGIKSTAQDFSKLKITNLPSDLTSDEKLVLQISGMIQILADIDINIIGQRLLGSPKDNARKLMDEFAGISSVTASIRPIWKRSFPDNLSKIYVKTTLGQ